MGDLSEHLDSSEFACPCCGKNSIAELLPVWLEHLRLALGGHAMYISRGGGVRCKDYNEQIRSCGHVDDGADRPHGSFHGRACPKCGRQGMQRSAIRSRHMDGTEADIRVADVSPDEVAAMAEALGFRNVGWYDTFTHVGIGGKPGRTARWDMRSNRG